MPFMAVPLDAVPYVMVTLILLGVGVVIGAVGSGDRAAALPQGLATAEVWGEQQIAHLPHSPTVADPDPDGPGSSLSWGRSGGRPPRRDWMLTLLPARSARRGGVVDGRGRRPERPTGGQPGPSCRRCGTTSPRRRRPARRPSAISPLSIRTSTAWRGGPHRHGGIRRGRRHAGPASGGTRRAHDRADQEAQGAGAHRERPQHPARGLQRPVGERLQVGRARGVPGRLARAAGLALAVDGAHRPAVEHRRAGPRHPRRRSTTSRRGSRSRGRPLETERARVSTIEQKQTGDHQDS